jgi:hypothetical protein
MIVPVVEYEECLLYPESENEVLARVHSTTYPSH